MRKPVVVAAMAALSAAALLAMALAATWPDPEPEREVGAEPEVAQEVAPEPTTEPHVIMPTKSSRPGCEDEGLCYIPEAVAVDAGQTVVWKNGDAAFHSVTSGSYGEADGLFDSGHMDPEETFSYTFDEPGVYDYHCTLHPWMSGIIAVE